MDELKIIARPHILSDRDSEILTLEGDRNFTITQVLDEINWPIGVREEHTAFIVDGVEILPAEYDSYVVPPNRHTVVSLMARGGQSGVSIKQIVVLAILIVVQIFTYGATSELTYMYAASIAFTFIAGLFAPKNQKKPTDSSGSDGNFVVNGQSNQAAPYSLVQRIYGQLRVAPNVVGLPFNSSTGPDNFSSIVYTFGYGPLQLENFQIGDTRIADIQGVEYNVYQQYQRSTTTSLQYYTIDVDQQGQNVILNQGVPFVLTTSTETAAAAIEVTFPYGIYGLDAKGGRGPWGADFKVEYREFGETTWHGVFDGGVTPIIPVTGARSYFYGDNASIQFIAGVYLKSYTTTFLVYFPRYSRWEMRISRLTQDDETWPSDQGQRISQAILTGFRSFRSNTRPFTPSKPVTLLELHIRGNDQISGAVQQVTALATSILRVWNGKSFSMQPTRNPAWVFLDILTGSANPKPVSDSRIDLDNLLQWANFCGFIMPDGLPRYMFDYQFSDATTVLEALNTVTGAGRASFTIKDGKFGVVIDAEQTVPVQVFTPLNAHNIQGVKRFQEPPHAIRVKFISPQRDYSQDEVVVYNDGYNALNATVFEELTLPGVTNPNQAWRDGRYYLAQALLRVEEVTLTADIENLVCRRNDLVLIQSQTIGVGGDARRVVSYNATTRILTVDAPLFLAGGASYAARVRTQVGKVSDLIAVTPVDDHTFQLAANSSSIQPDDLIVYGVSTTVTGEYLVKNIKASKDFTADITLIEVGRGVYTADTGAIPPYKPQGGTLNPGVGDPVKNLNYSVNQYYESRYPFADVTLYWTPPSGLAPLKYRIDRVYPTGNVNVGESRTASFTPLEHLDIASGAFTDTTYTFRVTPVWNAVTGTGTDITLTIPALAVLPPANVITGSYSIEKFGIRFTWGDLTDPRATDYELRVGPSWAEGVPLSGAVTRIRGTNYLWNVVAAGDYKVWIKAYDSTAGLYSVDPLLIEAIILAPVATLATYVISGPNYAIIWDQIPGTFATDRYRVYKGGTTRASIIAEPLSTRFEAKVDWGNNKDFWVTVIDVAGNESLPSQVSIQINLPGAVSGFTGATIDNNALLKWNKPVATLPIDQYIISRGEVFATAIPFGKAAGDQTFSSIFESAAGLYTYWIYAVDSAGNSGPAISLSLQLSPPPDFQLQADYYPVLTNSAQTTLSNFEVVDGIVTGPLVHETWQQHFANHAFSTPADQVTAGFPRYYQPSASSGYVEAVLDYGVVVDSSSISITASFSTLFGSPTVAPMISVKKTSTDAWTDYPATSQLFATNFRYVKARFTINAPVGTELVQFFSVNIKLALKKQTDAGSGTARAADANGSPVYFNKMFIDVDSISVTPIGTSRREWVVNFTDAPYPTMFRVLFFDPVTGNRVDQAFTWSAIGV